MSLPLLVVVPVLCYAALLLFLMAQQSREDTTHDLEITHRALSLVVERELTQMEKTMRLVAESPMLAGSDLDDEHLQSLMRGIVDAGWGFHTFAVLDRQGQALIEFPGPRRPRPDARLRPHHEEVFRTGRPVLSDLHESILDGKLSMSINLPVMGDEQVRAVLTARIEPAHLGRLLAGQTGRPEMIATLLDGQRQIVARSQEMDRFFGRVPSPQTLDAIDSAPSGTWRFLTLDGKELLWAWSALPNGWTLLLGTPAKQADEALRDSMIRLATGGLLALVLGLGLAALVARRITRSVDAMGENAARLAQGKAAEYYRPSGIRQLDQLYHALETASQRLVTALQERARALESERAARALADEHNRAKDVFIATLAHELRNPLSPIRTAAQVVKTPRSDEAVRRRAVEVIDRQVAAMARLLDDLLDISRISTGRIRLAPRRLTLRSVLESAVEVARPLIEKRGHTLTVELPDSEVWLDADPLRLGQVFSNLLTNAAKYTEPGGRIDVKARQDGGEVVVGIRDTGIGIEREALGGVFEMFSQVKSPLDRSEGGLGIGLALVRGLVGLQGGWVSAHSEGLGRGSEFRVGLPVASADAAPAPGEGRPGDAAADAPRLRILVADDNRDAAESLALLLAQEGHETRVAHGGEAALQQAEAFRPDLACLDIGMPDLNGYEVAQRLRATPWGARIRLVALTGWGTEEDRRRALQAGFDAHLTKPVDLQALSRLLRESPQQSAPGG
ncbi:hybrid sensor histidine kinase/response regulator [Caldimonas tepidiphila]|uniref:hybrid sensor histidine kinase/response regulator n=1 Tax=Caldimonas tepidiphila TaxID=2315841 RepID=UPI001474F066|nr:ATP-binding protein [Caldimonas tepidiphila]